MDRFIDRLGFDEQSFPKLVPDYSERSNVALSARNVLYPAVIIAIFTYWISREKIRVPNAPFITPRSIWDFQWRDAKLRFQADCIGIVNRGFKMVGQNPFRIIFDQGELLILPPSMAQEIRNIPQFSPGDFMKETTCAEIHGFEPYLLSTGGSLLADVTKGKLTASIKHLIQPMSECVANGNRMLFPQNNEWNQVTLKSKLLDLIALLSATVFLGDEAIASDPEWLQITTEYTVDSFLAARQLRIWPRSLQPLAASIYPRCRKIRQQLARVDAMMTPIINRRRAEKLPKERHDTIEWVEALAKERNIDYSPAAMQLNLALSAIHTTADLLTTTMYELIQSPDAVAALREEIVKAIGDGGLQYNSLYKLKLLDSAIKEAQRLKPILSVNMLRKSTGDITLSSGLNIPKGTRLGVSAHAQWDPTVFANPKEFQVDRFVKLSERPGEENKWQLSTTRPEQIGFGHGSRACPGRFLAANEIKIALCHLLLNYDWRLNASSPPIQPIQNGVMLDSSPMVLVDVRSRQPEVQLIV